MRRKDGGAWLLGAAAVAALCARLAYAEQFPPSPATRYTGTTIPTGGALIVTGPATVRGVQGFVNYGGAGFLQLYDANVSPAGGATPVWSSANVASGTEGAITFPMGGVRVVNGAYLVCSKQGDSFNDCAGSAGSYSVEIGTP